MIPEHNDDYPGNASTIFLNAAKEGFHSNTWNWQVLWFYVAIAGVYAILSISQAIWKYSGQGD
jgi:hypothetical protein